jgi:hypothetical protein
MRAPEETCPLQVSPALGEDEGQSVFLATQGHSIRGMVDGGIE